MNKPIPSIILSVILFLTAQTLLAQYEVKPAAINISGQNSVLNVDYESNRDFNVLWLETFGEGLPASWENVNLNDFCAFQYSVGVPQGPFSEDIPAINSSSSFDGFMILDSDYCNADNYYNNDPYEYVDAYIQTPAIDLSEYSSVGLRFEHFFRFCCNPEIIELNVMVSNNGTDWVEFDVSDGLLPNNISANPVIELINISAVAGGRENVWIRFHKKGASQYFWMIDDVSVVELIEDNLELVDIRHDGYTSIPVNIKQSINLAAKIKNIGGKAQNDIQLTVKVNDFLTELNSDVIPSLNPSSETLLEINDEFIFPARGAYKLDFEVMQAQNDQVPNNNFKETLVIASDSIFARDAGIYSSGDVVWPALEEISHTGNIFTLDEDAEATSISVALHENTLPGENVSAVIYSYSQGDGFNELVRSEIHEISADDINIAEGQALWFTMQVDAIALDAGVNYLASVEYNSDAVAVAADNIVWQPVEASFSNVNGMWQFETSTPMIRLNFGNNLGECEITAHFEIVNDFCEAGTGSVLATPLTGMPEFSFTWDTEPPVENEFISGLEAGNYNLTIEDALGCVEEFPITIEVTEIEYEVEIIPSACGGANGVATVTPLTGQEPFSYTWNTDPVQTGNTASGLEPGSYTVKITDANDCSIDVDVEMTGIPSITLDYEVTEPVCLNDNGSILVTPLTGTGPFTYSWSNDDEHEGQFQDNLTAGTYVIEVTDDNACPGIAEIELLPFDIEIIILGDIIHATCELDNGAVLLNVTNGVAPYEYLWSDQSTNKDLENVGPGSYSVLVTDAWGCQGEASFEMFNFGDALEIEFTVENTSACGESDGSIFVEPVNPESDYSYSWSTGDEGDFIDGLESGIYILTVYDNLGSCYGVFEIAVNDDELPEMTTHISHISCYGESDGSISISIPDGGFSYNWSTGSTESSIYDLGPDIYTVEIESDECFAVFEFEIIEPPLLEIEVIEEINPTCFNYSDGSIMVTAVGGTPEYIYLWDNQMTGNFIENLAAGEYNLTVADFRGCEAEKYFELFEPEEMIIIAQVVNPDMGQDNGSIEVTVIGGVGELTYDWDSGHTGSYITGLGPGLYTVTVTDENGCWAEETFELYTTSIHDPDFADNISLYPNPARDYVIIELGVLDAYKWNINLFDIRGILLNNIDISEVGGDVLIKINDLTKGYYLLQLVSEIGKYEQIIIVN